MKVPTGSTHAASDILSFQLSPGNTRMESWPSGRAVLEMLPIASG
jgi:hypothetical protein